MPYSIQKLRTCYQQKKSEIVQEMQACRELGHNGTREDLFSEMAYCICATGVRFELAREGIRMLKKKGFLFSGDEHFIHFYLLKGNVRFPKKKANCIIEARARFLDHGCELDIRDLVTSLISMPQKKARHRLWNLNIRGLGMKGCSHFLRNVGHGDELAILDTHILKILCEYGVIREIPKSLSDTKYLEIEEKMSEWAEQIGIPLGHLDFLLWGKETDYI